MNPARKTPNLWILAGVTYGLVIVTTIIALLWYWHLTAGTKQEERAGNITVGSVWISMYPGAIVHDTDTSKHGEVTEGTLKFGSGDAAGTVLAFYRTALHKSGYQLEANVDGRSVRAIGRAGKVEVMISADAQGQGSEVQIATVDRQKK